MPDYVDSNSGWLADQGMAAMQSGMAQEDYLFDRVKLVDWSRASTGPVSVLSASRLHERQPGAIVFRRVTGHTIGIQVVMLVLETPTAGVHQIALRNSLWFLRAWNACTGSRRAPLRILGPSFSGSTVSLASVIGEPPFRTSFAERIVITGSATADENAEKMATFSHGAIFRATVQTTSRLKERMAAYLTSLNSKWEDGNHVALLNESNTAYGGDASTIALTTSANAAATPTDRAQEDCSNKNPALQPFALAKVFNFPLHVAQLRSDAPSLGQSGTALLTAPVVPLNMREATPPSDLIPALRPQLTSPVVESTVDSILDAIRHEKISAVGIIATDDRDVLFLAREVKRAAPDVQLFLFGTHGLYLHPDYLPYVRGALVASSYALTLANQPEIKGAYDALHRQPFPSMSAEGVFYATRALVSVHSIGEAEKDTPLMPYRRGAVQPTCVPVAPASISVIGEDGYWTLPNVGKACKVEAVAGSPSGGPGEAIPDAVPAPSVVPAPSELNVAALPDLPLQFGIGALLVLAIVTVHVWVMPAIKRVFDSPAADHSLLEWPFIRVLVPPRTFNKAAKFHRFAVSICFSLLALVAAWVVAVTLPFVLPEKLTPVAIPIGLAQALTRALIPFAVIATFLTVIYPAAMCYGPRRSLPDALTPNASAPVRRRGSVKVILRGMAVGFWNATLTEQAGWLLFVGMVATMGIFAVVVFWAVVGSVSCGAEGLLICDEGRSTLARIVGGGIISPAALTVCLVAAFYIVMLTGVRRLSLVGFGYARLGQGSSAFGLFTAEHAAAGEPKQGTLAAMLDMPTQNMPSVYPAVVLFGMLVAVVATRNITTIDGKAFSWFVMVGSWTTLGLGLLQLVQGLALWNAARTHLTRLAHTPIDEHLHEIAQLVPWDISLAPPRLTELMPVARMADSVLRDFRCLAFSWRDGRMSAEVRRNVDDLRGLACDAEARLDVRPGDLESLEPLFAKPSHVSNLEREMQVQEHAAIIQSEAWFGLWRLSDSLVTMLQRTLWLRSTTASASPIVRREAEVAGIEQVPGAPLKAKRVDVLELGEYEGVPHEDRSSGNSQTGWFKRCERLVALQIAFVLRDIVARTITCLFAAMLCLTLLTASHLFYTFNGRASLLMVDMLAIAGVALSSVWILVDMERDHVLSRLRATTPGRVDINWDFIKRIAVYGVLPLLAVIASLFPELGGTLFGWLEPLRKLSSI